MAPEQIDTPRLFGRRAREEDFADLLRLYQDAAVMRTLSADGRPLEVVAARMRLESGVAHWRQHGFGVWTFRNREDLRFVGYCGLKHSVVEGRPEVELLYALLSPEWGKGFATEMAAAVLAVGFTDLGLPEIVAFTLPHNTASRRVMEKSGFRCEREITHAGLPHVLYRLRREEWESIHSPDKEG